MRDIVITGEGVLCAIGLDKPSVLASLKSKHTGIGTMKHLCSSHKELPVGEVPLSNDDMRNMLGLTEIGFINRTTLMGMLAVRQALEDAGIDSEIIKERSLRSVLVSGTTVAGMDITERFFKDFENSDEVLQCLKTHSAGSCTRLIADYFGFFTKYTTISTACSSAANALMLGARMLTEREADIVVAGGTEALSLFHLNGFNSLMILDHEPCRPFDANRAGLNLGEGAAYVVMETVDGASRRGRKPHAYLTGFGNACDAYHQTASSDNGEGAYLAMTEALQMAGLKPEDIQYVNAHGTGTPNNDLSESMALKRVFESHMPLVSSTKAFTGHTTSASGSIESVICLMALKYQFVPANLGWSKAMEDGIVPTMGIDSYPLHNVVCNSFGFGGNDSSLVFSRKEEGGMRNEKCLRQDQRQEYSPSSFLLPPSSEIKELSRVEITSIDQLSEIRDYIKPMEARRMGKLMKASLLSSLKALKQAGIECPDAIITGTALGCWENSEALLMQLLEEGEVMLSPTNFMQSTHNTISSNIAIRLGCHGYNVTYTQSDDSFEWALRDARLLLQSGRYKTVLVGCHDETTPLYRSLMARLGIHDLPAIHSVAIVLRNESK